MCQPHDRAPLLGAALWKDPARMVKGCVNTEKGSLFCYRVGSLGTQKGFVELFSEHNAPIKPSNR